MYGVSLSTSTVEHCKSFSVGGVKLLSGWANRDRCFEVLDKITYLNHEMSVRGVDLEPPIERRRLATVQCGSVPLYCNAQNCNITHFIARLKAVANQASNAESCYL